jgi:hypothetical protein
MKRSLIAALAVLFAVAAAPYPAAAQSPQCSAFAPLKQDAEKKAAIVKAAIEAKHDRKEICGLVQNFYAAEGLVVKFLEDNKTWCGIPEQFIKSAKAGHEHSGQFRTAVCTEAPVKPRTPSLSDAIGTPSVDTGANTKTGRGTLDSLNGNPLAR